jgi:hypothetical protein
LTSNRAFCFFNTLFGVAGENFNTLPGIYASQMDGVLRAAAEAISR